MPAAATIIRSKGAEYRGQTIPAFQLNTSLYADFGEPAYKLVPKAEFPGLKAQLYEIGRDRLVLGREDAQSLPEEIGLASELVYNDCQKGFNEKDYKGTWHLAVRILDRDAKTKGNGKPGDSYRTAIVYLNIEGLEEGSKGWEIISSKNTKEEQIWMPPEGIMVPSHFRPAYNHFGLPEETLRSERAAIERFVKIGFTPEQAKNELSKLYWSEGLRAVLSKSSGSYGPCSVSLVYFGPRVRNMDVGSFAASSLAERSEAAPDSGCLFR